MPITFDETVERIVKRSAGAYWSILSRGFALVLTPHGFALTAMPQIYRGADVHSRRVIIPCEDGKPMPDGHLLTERERDRAVRAILGDSSPPSSSREETGAGDELR
jgi:hypothetical protein